MNKFGILIEERLFVPRNATDHGEIQGVRISRVDETNRMARVDVDGSEGAGVESPGLDVVTDITDIHCRAFDQWDSVTITNDTERRKLVVTHGETSEVFDVYKDARFRAVELLAQTIIDNTGVLA